jgi:hypothetical protein
VLYALAYARGYASAIIGDGGVGNSIELIAECLALANLGQVIQALSKTIRAMSDGSLDSQVGARICSGLGIMRACFETQKLEQLEERVEKIIDHVPYKRIRTEEAEVYVPSGANGHDHAGATRLISADETERHPN